MPAFASHGFRRAIGHFVPPNVSFTYKQIQLSLNPTRETIDAPIRRPYESIFSEGHHQHIRLSLLAKFAIT